MKKRSALSECFVEFIHSGENTNIKNTFVIVNSAITDINYNQWNNNEG